VDEGLELPPKYRHDGSINTPALQRSSYGAKVLGSYIGSDEYIRRRLEEQLEEWKRDVDCLVEFPFIQLRMLLFRYCFSPRPIHLLRTLSRRHTEHMVHAFIDLQRRVLESMFGRTLDAHLMDWFSLPIDEGGLGLLNLKDVHSIAHIASVFSQKQFRDGYVQLLETTVDNVETTVGFVRDLHDALNKDMKVHLRLGHHATDSDVMEELEQIAAKSRKKNQGTFQNALYLMTTPTRQAELEQMLSETALLTYHSKCLVNDSAGKWLQVFPKYS